MRNSKRNSGKYLESAYIRLLDVTVSSVLISLQIGFKIFLNITPTVTNWTADNKQFSLIFEENPLADFVELPDDGRAQDELWYSNILCGIIRGALEMVSTHPVFMCQNRCWYLPVSKNLKRYSFGILTIVLPIHDHGAFVRRELL